jgi:hypothetical protein
VTDPDEQCATANSPGQMTIDECIGEAERERNERVAAALRFAALGCRIAPAAGKNPGGYLGEEWQRKATRDPDLIAAWWQAWPLANVAILPDRALLPVDVDGE